MFEESTKTEIKINEHLNKHQTYIKINNKNKIKMTNTQQL